MELETKHQKEAEEYEANKTITFNRQIPDSCTVLQVATTNCNTFLVSTSGYVYSWGQCTFALGRKVLKPLDATKPSIIESLVEKNIVNLACGSNHVVALDSEGWICSWGENNCGQLGHDNLTSAVTPQVVPLPHPEEELNLKASRVSAGSDFSFAVSTGSPAHYYVWGNNSNYRLGVPLTEAENGIFKSPKSVINPIWGNSSEIIVAHNKRGKNIAYKTNLSSEVALGGVSKYELQRINTDNSDLKRRLETSEKRIKELENKLYGENISPSGSAFSKDALLESFKEIYEESLEEKESSTKEIQTTKNAIAELEIEISEVEKSILQQEETENELKEELDTKEEEIRFSKLLFEQDKSYTDELEKIKTLKLQKNKLHEDLKELSKEKEHTQKNLQKIQNKLKQMLSKETTSIQTKKHAELKEKIFSEILKNRKNQVVQQFFKKSQKAVTDDLENLISIWEAAQDTSLEYISKSLVKSCTSEYLNSSNHMLNQITNEVQTMKKPQETYQVFEKLNNMWNILEHNLELRNQVNNLTAGLLSYSASEVSKADWKQPRFDELKAESHISREELKKKILSKKNAKLLKQETPKFDWGERP